MDEALDTSQHLDPVSDDIAKSGAEETRQEQGSQEVARDRISSYAVSTSHAHVAILQETQQPSPQDESINFTKVFEILKVKIDDRDCGDLIDKFGGDNLDGVREFMSCLSESSSHNEVLTTYRIGKSDGVRILIFRAWLEQEYLPAIREKVTARTLLFDQETWDNFLYRQLWMAMRASASTQEAVPLGEEDSISSLQLDSRSSSSQETKQAPTTDGTVTFSNLFEIIHLDVSDSDRDGLIHRFGGDNIDGVQRFVSILGTHEGIKLLANYNISESDRQRLCLFRFWFDGVYLNAREQSASSPPFNEETWINFCRSLVAQGKELLPIHVREIILGGGEVWPNDLSTLTPSLPLLPSQELGTAGGHNDDRGFVQKGVEPGTEHPSCAPLHDGTCELLGNLGDKDVDSRKASVAAPAIPKVVGLRKRNLSNSELQEGAGFLSSADVDDKGPRPMAVSIGTPSADRSNESKYHPKVVQSIWILVLAAAIVIGVLTVSAPATVVGGSIWTDRGTKSERSLRDVTEDNLKTFIRLKSRFTSFDNQTSPQTLALRWMLAEEYATSGELSNERLLQRFAMATLRFATGGAVSGENSTWMHKGWLVAGRHECNWGVFEEIKCNNKGQLRKLDLWRFDFMAGTVPAEIGLLTTLRYLNLSDNESIHGPIPGEIGLLTQLTQLYLWGNGHLGETIPTQLGELSSTLQILELAHSGLVGRVPTELGRLTRLYSLSLDRNNLTGPLPSQFEKLTDLKRLFMYGTEVTGTLPKSLCPLLEVALIDCGEVSCACCRQGKLTGGGPSCLYREAAMVATEDLYPRYFRRRPTRSYHAKWP